MAKATHATEAIVIGGSAGALDALSAILPALPGDFPLPIAIVLHLLPGRPSQLASVLASRSALPVRETDDKQPFVPGCIYVAPPNYHLLLERTRTFALSVDAPVLFSRPSIDVLFETAAEAYGPALCGVLLSGANDDGARGLVRIAEACGRIVIQDPGSATARIMPEAALRLTRSEHVLPLARIGPFLANLPARSANSLEREE